MAELTRGGFFAPPPPSNIGYPRTPSKIGLNEAFRTQCIVATSASGWMTEERTEQYIREVLGVFTFGKRRLPAWNSFRCHLTDGVKELLSKGLIDPAIVPRGCTKFIQAPDVSWNKPMKELLCESYDS